MKLFMRVLKVVGATLGLILGLYLMVAFLVRPFLASWGASAEDMRAPLAGDDMLSTVAAQVTLAIDIDAAPEAVWPWLMQMGVDRAGFYTYTWVENALGLDVRNSDGIHPEWQGLHVGDIVAFTTAESYPSVGRTGPWAARLVPNEVLVMCMGPIGECPGTWQLVLQRTAAGKTRLLMRGRSGGDMPIFRRVPDLLMDTGYLMMERKMLLGIKARAEGAHYPSNAVSQRWRAWRLRTATSSCSMAIARERILDGARV
jgi:hypothetical protein